MPLFCCAVGEKGSGKGSIAVAQHIPGSGRASLETLRAASTSGLAHDMARLRMVAHERGEKLSETEEKTQRMHDDAKKLSASANAVSACVVTYEVHGNIFVVACTSFLSWDVGAA